MTYTCMPYMVVTLSCTDAMTRESGIPHTVYAGISDLRFELLHHSGGTSVSAECLLWLHQA